MREKPDAKMSRIVLKSSFACARRRATTVREGHARRRTHRTRERTRGTSGSRAAFHVASRSRVGISRRLHDASGSRAASTTRRDLTPPPRRVGISRRLHDASGSHAASTTRRDLTPPPRRVGISRRLHDGSTTRDLAPLLRRAQAAPRARDHVARESHLARQHEDVLGRRHHVLHLQLLVLERALHRIAHLRVDRAVLARPRRITSSRCTFAGGSRPVGETTTTAAARTGTTTTVGARVRGPARDSARSARAPPPRATLRFRGRCLRASRPRTPRDALKVLSNRPLTTLRGALKALDRPRRCAAL